MAKNQSREEYNEYMRSYMAARYYKRQAMAVEQLGGMCTDCGSREELEFDHAVRTTKSFTIGKVLASCSEKRLQAELAKIVLRCKSCHSRKTIVERGHTPLADRPHGSLNAYRKGCRCTDCRAARATYCRARRSSGGRRLK